MTILLPFIPRVLVLSLVPVFFFACQPEPCNTQLAFYHWKTQFAPDSTAQAYLESGTTERLYLRVFDVDWDFQKQDAIPKAEVRIREDAIGKTTIVPTIYITNRTLLQASPAQVDMLCRRMLEKITELLPGYQAPEIQLDCDWTESSKEAYFRLLGIFRSQLPSSTQLSATLRLHQYRWPEKTGVPPVDRTMLMFYNMGELEDWNESNSILNLTKAEAYLQHTSTYPIPIDLALPLFRWGVLYRNGKMIKLINGLTATDLATAKAEPLPGREQTHFRIPESTYLQGYYLYAGDELRLEWISSEALTEAARLLRNVPHTEKRYLAFYHLDGKLLNDFHLATLKQVQQVLDQEMEYE